MTYRLWAKTEFGRRAFSSAAPQIWNHIPTSTLSCITHTYTYCRGKKLENRHHLTPSNVTLKHIILPPHNFPTT